MKEALAKDHPRKQKVIEIAPEMILELLRVPFGGIQVGSEVITSVGEIIPDSARVLRAAIGDQGNVLLVVEDESFVALGEACRLPTMNLKYSAKRIRRDRRGEDGVCDFCGSDDGVIFAADGAQECAECRGDDDEDDDEESRGRSPGQEHARRGGDQEDLPAGDSTEVGRTREEEAGRDGWGGSLEVACGEVRRSARCVSSYAGVDQQ